MHQWQRHARQEPERGLAAQAGGGGQLGPASAQQKLRVVSVTAEGNAVVSAPAGKQHAHALLLRAALHHVFADEDVRAGTGAVEAQQVDQVSGARRAVEHPQPFLPAHGIDEVVLGGVRFARRLAAGLRQPTEGERRRPAPSPQFARREDGDAGRIQAAAEMRADGIRAVQAGADGLREEIEELLRVVVVGGPPHDRDVFRPPVPLQLHDGR